MNLDDPDVTS